MKINKLQKHTLVQLRKIIEDCVTEMSYSIHEQCSLPQSFTITSGVENLISERNTENTKV